MESLIKNIDGYANNSDNSPTTKVGEHIPCGYSMTTIWAFDNTEDKHILYCGEDCMKRFSEFLRKEKNVIFWKLILF